jgi:hypothetical protein
MRSEQLALFNAEIPTVRAANSQLQPILSISKIRQKSLNRQKV